MNNGQRAEHLLEPLEPLWKRVSPPLFWSKHELLIVGDRHLPNGRRQHLVLGSVEQGTTLDGADIVGTSENTRALYELEFSHLSRSGASRPRI